MLNRVSDAFIDRVCDWIEHEHRIVTIRCIMPHGRKPTKIEIEKLAFLAAKNGLCLIDYDEYMRKRAYELRNANNPDSP